MDFKYIPLLKYFELLLLIPINLLLHKLNMR